MELTRDAMWEMICDLRRTVNYLEKRNPDLGTDVPPSERIKWCIVCVVYASENILSEDGCIITQECLYLVKASNPETAYEEAMEVASKTQIVPVGTGQMADLPLVGITEIMPIHEPFDHGNELTFRDVVYTHWVDIEEQILDRSDAPKSFDEVGS
jgi:hypothetical protein